jgi:glycosyltransferase involved in cell wall biosynthesis
MLLLASMPADDPTPLRVLASAVALGSSGGIAVLEGLGGALARVPGVSLRIAVPAKLRERLESHLPSHALIPVAFRSKLARLLWEERELPRLARRSRADVVFGMTNTLPLTRSLGKATGAVLIQNIAPLLPDVRDLYRGRARARMQALNTLTLASVRRADVTFLFSRYGRDLVSALEPRARVSTIPPGGLPAIALPLDERSVGDHVLVLADLYRYKGVEQVIEAIADPRLTDLRLVVAGAAMDTDYVEDLHARSRRSGVSDRVSFIGRVPRTEVIQLLRSARCLVQPSHVESLALPMLEALQLGVPVVSTDIPIARELCGDAATYFPPGDIAALAGLLVALPMAPPGEPPLPLEWKRTAEAIVAELLMLRRH